MRFLDRVGNMVGVIFWMASGGINIHTALLPIVDGVWGVRALAGAFVILSAVNVSAYHRKLSAPDPGDTQ